MSRQAACNLFINNDIFQDYYRSIALGGTSSYALYSVKKTDKLELIHESYRQFPDDKKKVAGMVDEYRHVLKIGIFRIKVEGSIFLAQWCVLNLLCS